MLWQKVYGRSILVGKVPVGKEEAGEGEGVTKWQLTESHLMIYRSHKKFYPFNLPHLLQTIALQFLNIECKMFRPVDGNKDGTEMYS